MSEYLRDHHPRKAFKVAVAVALGMSNASKSSGPRSMSFAPCGDFERSRLDGHLSAAGREHAETLRWEVLSMVRAATRPPPSSSRVSQEHQLVIHGTTLHNLKLQL